jgi:AcrR family transcriptional regulator
MAKSRGQNQALFHATHCGVLDAAKGMFAVEGYSAVATQRIAEAAAVSHGSVFHHFKSKRELFMAVHDGYQAQFIERLDAALVGAEDAWDRFDRFWRGYLDVARDPEIRRVLLQDGPQIIGLKELRDRGGRSPYARMEAEIERLMTAGAIPRRSNRALALLLFGALNQAVNEMAEFPDDAALQASLTSEIATMIDRLR